MTRRLLSAVVVSLFIAVFAHAQGRGAVDWIFVVDTSKSMRGLGENAKDIFGDVKESLKTFVREAAPGDSVTIFAFDRETRLYSPSTEITGTAREDLFTVIDALKADGDRTHLGEAIAKGLDRAASLPRLPNSTRSRAVVLFTDGKQDVRGMENHVPISSNIERVGDSYVFLVSMGEHEEQLDELAKATP